MTDDDVALCNRMLTRLGVNQISSLDDSSREARLIKANFDYLRDDVNALHPWGFAMKQVEMAQDGTAPVWGATYRYALPSDYLGFISTKTEIEGGDEPFRIQGDYLITNAATVKIEYCSRVEDINKWPTLVRDAFVSRLQAELVGALTDGKMGSDRFFKIYQEKISTAMAYDAAEHTPREFYIDEWLGARYGGGSFAGKKVSDF